jgi:beta-lactamase regulating signal transducer with metallopeptidase domain
VLPTWERILFFHFIPSVLDGLVALAGVLLLLRIFRVRNPSTRALFLFVPLVRPLIILLEGGARLERVSAPNVTFAIRLPDPLDLIPVHFADLQQPSTVSQIIILLIAAVLLIAIGFLSIRWAGLLFFYRRLRKQSGGTVPPELRSLVSDLSRVMGLEDSPRIIVSQGVWATPCAIGWRHPALVIDPRIMQEFTRDELRAIVAHELSHIKRGDCLWHWVSVLLRDVQSYSPFSYLSLAQIGLEREKACDKAAIQFARIPPGLLAQCLVKASTLSVSSQLKPLPGYGMAFTKGQFGLMKKRLEFLMSISKSQPGTIGQPGTFGEPGTVRTVRSVSGKAGKAILLISCIPLTFLQLYISVWIGTIPMVIK